MEVLRRTDNMLIIIAPQTILDVDATGTVLLPEKCRFMARFARLVIVSASDGMGADPATDLSTKKIGVQ